MLNFDLPQDLFELIYCNDRLSKVNRTLLQSIATPPYETNYMFAEKFETLDHLRGQLVSKVCNTTVNILPSIATVTPSIATITAIVDGRLYSLGLQAASFTLE